MLGVLSLIIYSLVLVISIKYMVLVLRADNKGEGGILSLTSLLPPRGSGRQSGWCCSDCSAPRCCTATA